MDNPYVCLYYLLQLCKNQLAIYYFRQVAITQMPCTPTSCQGNPSCCTQIAFYPGFYCKIASQCYQEPLWQMIVIPSLLGFLALVLALIVCCKLRGAMQRKRNITNYAYEEVRVKPQPLGLKYRTLTTVPETPNNMMTMNKFTQPSPTQNNIPIISQISSGQPQKLNF